MTVKYYLKYCLWGFIGCGYLVYSILTDLRDDKIFPDFVPFMPYLAAYLTVAAVIFPVSFWTLEYLTTKGLNKNTWENYFSESSPSWRVFIFAYAFSIVLSAPLFLIFFFVRKKKPA